MQLPGSLRRTTLGDVLGALFRGRATGWLELTEQRGAFAGGVHRIALEEGLVSEVSTPRSVTRLGHIVGALERLPRPVVDRALARAPRDRRAGDVLIELELASRATVEEAVRMQRREKLEVLFALPDAKIAFRVAGRRDRTARPLLPGEFLHGRPRLRDAAPPPGADRLPRRRRDCPRRHALDMLGLDEGAGRAQVQQAFRRLAAALHPDRFPRASREEKAAIMRRFAELSAAYHSLVS